jgi:O-antigen ligase
MRQLFIIFLVLNWLVEGDFRNKFRIIGRSKAVLLFIGFYLLHLLGLLYTSNMDSGLFDVQMKMTLLIFPLIYVTRPINRRELYGVFYSLIAGGIVASLIMLATAAVIYFNSGQNKFFYEEFSFLIHPSYLSMYLNFAIAWLVLGIVERHKSLKFMATFWAVLIIAFFSVIIVLLSSKLGLLTLLLIYFGALIYYILSRRKYILGIAGLIAVVLAISAVLYYVPEISGRVQTALTALTSDETNVTEAESTAVRMLVWKASNKVIGQNPLVGVGTGDAKDELMKEYSAEGMTGAIANSLNCHNEYYQVFVTLGIIGFLVFTLHLLGPLRKAYRKKNIIYVLFLVIVMFNFLTESMLETQAGVLFFALFNSLLCFCTFDNDNLNINRS